MSTNLESKLSCSRDFLEACIQNVPSHNEANLNNLIQRSKVFSESNIIPIHTTRSSWLLALKDKPKYDKLNNFYSEEILLDNVNRSYPILHESILPLIEHFIIIKREFGSDVEKRIYHNITLMEFVDRLLCKRPLKFVGEIDSYMLRDTGLTGAGGFEIIGSDDEVEPLVMQNYMTYDEMKIAALLSTSSPVSPINSGSRHNGGIIDESANFESRAIYVGLVGTRMHKEGFMEYQDILICKDFHKIENGYGRFTESTTSKKSPVKQKIMNLYASLYKIPYFPTFKEIKKSKKGISSFFSNKFHKYLSTHYTNVDTVHEIKSSTLGESKFFNEIVYKNRVRISIETLLIEADSRAKDINKQAWVHVVGLGLGVWRVASCQDEMFVEVFAECFNTFKFENISDVVFSWIRVNSCGGIADGEKFPGTNIKLHFNMRNPFDKLEPPDSEKLIVASWAWDANSFVGNEYWSRSLQSSSDPAAACCSQIPELHNPFINERMRGNNLHIASKAYGILPIEVYAVRALTQE